VAEGHVGLPWRRKIASLNYLLASHVWRQDHNGFTHQDPGFIDHVVNKKAEVVRVYLPPDANCLLSVMDHCLRSRHYVNVVIAGKHPAPQWLTMDAAVKHCTEGIGIWQWASNDQGVAPDVVMACCGDVPTLETLAAVSILREHLPDLKIRVVNVVDLMKLQPQTEHPHGLSDMDFDELFTKDKPVIFAFHAYPWLIHRLTYRRTNHDNIHVRGYKEEGTITTPFDMTVLNELDRFPPRDGHHRPPAADRRQGHLPEAAAQGQADRAQAIHRQIRRGPAGNPQLEMEQPQMNAGHPGEKITEGLDGLRDRLAEYSQMGARFAKWRAVIAPGDGIPTRGCIEANAQALARYAALCQEAGLVPVVEPEVLMDGEHSLERCFEVTEEVLRTVFNQLYTQRVMLEGMILKPNMVLPGLTCPRQETVDAVADATVKCLLRAVPAAVPGITFLSGGQSSELASARLNAMNARFKSRLPWALAFSFARAIQQPAMEIWRGEEAHVLAAQQALYHRARCNWAARRGEYSAAMEKASA
jgi:fructose-bisphosphate aldolase class 1